MIHTRKRTHRSASTADRKPGLVSALLPVWMLVGLGGTLSASDYEFSLDLGADGFDMAYDEPRELLYTAATSSVL